MQVENLLFPEHVSDHEIISIYELCLKVRFNAPMDKQVQYSLNLHWLKDNSSWWARAVSSAALPALIQKQLNCLAISQDASTEDADSPG